VVSAVKSGAVSLMRGTLDVTGSAVAVLMIPPKKRFWSAGLMVGQTIFVQVRPKNKTHPLSPDGFAKLLRYTHPGGLIQQQMQADAGLIRIQIAYAA
jgi:hypothetical protein